MWRDRLAIYGSESGFTRRHGFIYPLIVFASFAGWSYWNGLLYMNNSTVVRGSYAAYAGNGVVAGSSARLIGSNAPGSKSNASFNTAASVSAAQVVRLSAVRSTLNLIPTKLAQGRDIIAEYQWAPNNWRPTSCDVASRSTTKGLFSFPIPASGRASTPGSLQVTTRMCCFWNAANRRSSAMRASCINTFRGRRLRVSRSNRCSTDLDNEVAFSNSSVAIARRASVSVDCFRNLALIRCSSLSNRPSSVALLATSPACAIAVAADCWAITTRTLANWRTVLSARAPKNSNNPSPMILATANQNPSVRSPFCNRPLLSSSNTLPSLVIRYLVGRIRSARSSKRIPTKSATVAIRSQINHTSALCSNHTLMISSITDGENGIAVSPLMAARQRRERIENVVITCLIVAVVIAAADSIQRSFRG